MPRRRRQRRNRKVHRSPRQTGALCPTFPDGSSESGEEEDSEEEGEATAASLASDNLLTLEIERKQQIPNRLHPELWFNEYKQVRRDAQLDERASIFSQGNDGPVCRCSDDDRKFGIRHQMFFGEKVRA